MRTKHHGWDWLFKQLRYRFLKFKFFLTKLSYLALVSKETSNVFIFSVINASDLKFCPRSYSCVYLMMRFWGSNENICKMMTSHFRTLYSQRPLNGHLVKGDTSLKQTSGAGPCCTSVIYFLSHPRGGGGYSPTFWVGVCHTVVKTLTLFQTKMYDFLDPFSDLTPKIYTPFQIIQT